MLRGAVELASRWVAMPVRADLGPVALEPRKHVHVHVEDFLESYLTVSEEEVHALAGETRSPLCGGGALCQGPKLAPYVLIQISETGGMFSWNDHCVAGPSRSDGYEAQDDLIFAEDGGVAPASYDLAEVAVRCGVAGLHSRAFRGPRDRARLQLSTSTAVCACWSRASRALYPSAGTSGEWC